MLAKEVVFILLASACAVLLHQVQCGYQNTNNYLDYCQYRDRSHRIPNRCENFNEIIVEPLQFHGGTSFWCIVVDNRKNKYTSNTLTIDYSRGFRITWIIADSIASHGGGLQSVFRINGGINRIVIQSYNDGENLPDLVSMTLNDMELCHGGIRSSSSSDRVYDTDGDFEIPVKKHVYSDIADDNIEDNQFISENNNIDEYRFLNECSRLNRDKLKSKWCRKIGDMENVQFYVVKRTLDDGEQFWCIILQHNKRHFKNDDILSIEFDNPNKFVAWIPSEAYIGVDGVLKSLFNLADRKTTVAVSSHENHPVPNIKNIYLNDEPICDHLSKMKTKLHVNKIREVKTTNTPKTTASPQITTTKQQPIKITTKPPKSKVSGQCGRTKINHQTFISFGMETKPGDWPWHAAVFHYKTRIQKMYACGGSLINRNTILTAAHCVYDASGVIIAERMSVDLGRYDLITSSSNTQEFKVYDVIVHENYNVDTIENDIALLVLSTYVRLTNYIQIVCLPNGNMNFDGQTGQVVGWGRNENFAQQKHLFQASMPVVDHMVCLESNRDFYGQFLSDRNFCAGFHNNTNVCRGDSGGGLVFQVGEQWMIGGITSLGVALNASENCDITQFAIFTDVVKYIDWIESNINL